MQKVETDAGIFELWYLSCRFRFESETFGIKGMKDHAFKLKTF